MQIADYIAQVGIESDRLLESASDAGLDAAVPSCPDWQVRDLITHVGGVYRWAADLVANQRAEFGTEAGAAVGTGPDDAELIGWARDGRDEVLTALRSAPADLTCFTMWPTDSALEFWGRRQAHESAIHRADADVAAGRPTTYDDALAFDGIEEMLYGFAARKKDCEPTVIRLVAGAHAWQVSMGGTGVDVARLDDLTPTATPDVTVSGSPSDLYLWLWNRPSAATVDGAAEAAARWEQIRVRWS